MRTYNIILATLAAFTTSRALRFDSRSTFEKILSRQAVADSSTCTSTCTPLLTSTQTCTTVACLCTAAVEQSAQSCINCLANTNASPADLQNITSGFNSGCAGNGLAVVTIPGAGAGAPAASPTTFGSPNSFSTDVASDDGFSTDAGDDSFTQPGSFTTAGNTSPTQGTGGGTIGNGGGFAGATAKPTPTPASGTGNNSPQGGGSGSSNNNNNGNNGGGPSGQNSQNSSQKSGSEASKPVSRKLVDGIWVAAVAMVLAA